MISQTRAESDYSLVTWTGKPEDPRIDIRKCIKGIFRLTFSTQSTKTLWTFEAADKVCNS